MTALVLQKAMKKVLDDMSKVKNQPRLHHSKQILRQLMKHNTGVSNIEITDQNIRDFSSTAKKYGLDFALKKDTSGEHTRYLVFFKDRDVDVITAAFREFSAKIWTKSVPFGANWKKRRSSPKRSTWNRNGAKRQKHGNRVWNDDRKAETGASSPPSVSSVRISL